MKLILCASSILTLALLTACGADKEEPTGVIPEHQLKAIEKAKNVEQVLLDAQKQRDKALDDYEY